VNLEQVAQLLLKKAFAARKSVSCITKYHGLLVFGGPDAVWYIGPGLGVLDTRKFY
jgi:hypothetical protein